MKTLMKVPIEPIYLESYLPGPKEMEFGKLYISKKFCSCKHLCLCGCGEPCYMTLTPDHEDGWTLSVEATGKINITPSIQQLFGCRSHYVITKGIANFC